MPALILARSEDYSQPMETAETLHALMLYTQLVVANNMEDRATWPDLIENFVANTA